VYTRARRGFLLTPCRVLRRRTEVATESGRRPSPHAPPLPWSALRVLSPARGASPRERLPCAATRRHAVPQPRSQKNTCVCYGKNPPQPHAPLSRTGHHTRENSSEAFTPPKPNEFESAASMPCTLRAWPPTIDTPVPRDGREEGRGSDRGKERACARGARFQTLGQQLRRVLLRGRRRRCRRRRWWRRRRRRRREGRRRKRKAWRERSTPGWRSGDGWLKFAVAGIV